VLYPTQAAGESAIRLLEEGALLGVSVDLDDVDFEFIDRRPPEARADEDDGEVVLLASLTSASVLTLPDGGHHVRATHVRDWIADSGGGGPMRTTHTVAWATDAGGRVTSPATLHAALTASGILTAAAGDGDEPGEVLFSESAGDYVMRITRGRVRGATLVSMPAFAGARITLDDQPEVVADGAPSGRMREVVAYVATCPVPVAARDVAEALGMSIASARDYLTRAAAAGGWCGWRGGCTWGLRCCRRAARPRWWPRCREIPACRSTRTGTRCGTGTPRRRGAGVGHQS
jgi:hypothetical protein